MERTGTWKANIEPHEIKLNMAVVVGLYEGVKVCLLNDLVGTIYCVQTCKFYAEEAMQASGHDAFNNVNSVCGWLVGQHQYAGMFSGFNDMRLNASRMLIGLEPCPVMDMNAYRLALAMKARVVELNAVSGSPLPEEVFDVAFTNYHLKFMKKFARVSQMTLVPKSFFGCNGCGLVVKTKWCSGCRVYRYCCPECQLAHHPAHRESCRAIQAHLNPPELARYACGLCLSPN